MQKFFNTALLFCFTLFFYACKDKCQDSDCLNGGFCNEGTCWCPKGYKGTSCEIETRANMLGSYTGEYSYTVNNGSNITMLDTVSIMRSDGESSLYTDLRFWIQRMNRSYVFTVVDTNHFSASVNIPNKMNASIQGTLKDGKLTFTEKVTYDNGSPQTYNFVGTKAEE